MIFSTLIDVPKFDHKTKKTFLKRTKVQGLSETNFYVGAKLNVFGRQIDILDYADTPTRTKLANQRERFKKMKFTNNKNE